MLCGSCSAVKKRDVRVLIGKHIAFRREVIREYCLELYLMALETIILDFELSSFFYYIYFELSSWTNFFKEH